MISGVLRRWFSLGLVLMDKLWRKHVIGQGQTMKIKNLSSLLFKWFLKYDEIYFCCTFWLLNFLCYHFCGFLFSLCICTFPSGVFFILYINVKVKASKEVVSTFRVVNLLLKINSLLPVKDNCSLKPINQYSIFNQN